MRRNWNEETTFKRVVGGCDGGFPGAGCGQEVQDKSDKNSPSMFVCIETTTNWKVVYHKGTKVMYAVSNRRYNRGVFSPLYNADGTLQIYEESED